MKKILTTLLLLAFCTVQGTLAGEIVIIGSDGQARYEDESKNTEIGEQDIQNIKPKNILNEITITDETGRRENIYIDYKGNIKKVDEEQLPQITLPTVDSAKETEHQRYIQSAQKNLYDVESILELCGYYSKDNSSYSNKEFMKMNLLDGDYAVYYKDAPYIAEYHKDGSLMGLAKIDKEVLNDNKASVVFYEYRLGYNTTSSSMGLKHILFLNYEKGKYISQYIYNRHGELLCRQNNNDIYVASEARNMIPDWSKRSTKKAVAYNNDIYEYNQTYNQKRSINANEIANKVIGNTIVAISFPLMIVPPIGIPLLILGSLISGDFDHH